MNNFCPIYFVPTKQPLAALTFDDGPTPGVTDKILKFLDDKKISATFFMIGESVIKNPSLAREVAAAGHDVGVHSHRHKRGMKTWEYSAILDDFKRAKDAIASVTSQTPTMIRAPFGNICPTIARACQKLDLSYIGWSVATKDWFGDAKDKDWRLEFCTQGSIALFHDGGRVNPENVSRSIGMIDALSSRNNKLTSMTCLLAARDDPDDTAVCDIPMLGWGAIMMPSGEIRVVAYWPPSQILNGLTYGVETGGVKYSVDIPPMSNIDDWIKPVDIPPGHNVSCSKDAMKLFCSRRQLKLNLGCGDNKLPGWENFDIDIRAVDGVKPWAWNRPLPYADGTVSVVLVQHSLQHCKMEDYDSNFSEIRRVLEPGGKVVVKEADNRHYVWHRPGVTDRDGYIASSTSEPEVIQVLSRNGFSDLVTDRKDIVDRYGEAINRQKRLLGRQQLFVVEGTKAKGELYER